ncbi:hypothetical protein L1887_47032 [Cichorium endivia]|nr:hypothetical protein L1887_47032 [Cichorium endivia]
MDNGTGSVARSLPKANARPDRSGAAPNPIWVATPANTRVVQVQAMGVKRESKRGAPRSSCRHRSLCQRMELEAEPCVITEPEPNVTFAMSWMEAARADEGADEGAVGMVDALRLRLGVGVVANAVGVQCSRVHFECISSASQQLPPPPPPPPPPLRPLSCWAACIQGSYPTALDSFLPTPSSSHIHTHTLPTALNTWPALPTHEILRGPLTPTVVPPSRHMQAAATPSSHGASSPAATMAAAEPSPSSSSSSHHHEPSMSTTTELALPFMANHHRANNPDDPKLRANPSFKSRRSSLLANVLKPKSNKPDAARTTSSSRSLSSTHPPRRTTAHTKVGDARDQRAPLQHAQPLATSQNSRPPQLQSVAPPPRPDSTPPNTSAGSHSNTASSSDTLSESLLSLDAALPKLTTQHTQEPSHDSAVSTHQPSLDSHSSRHDDTLATPSSAVTTSASDPVPTQASVHNASQPISLPQSSSAFVTSPQRFSSLGRRSAARLTLDPSTLPSSLQMPRALARDINQELESPKSPSDALPTTPRNERRMSMLDFLATDSPTHQAVQPAPASLSAEHLPASMPLMQASHQFSLGASASSSSSSSYAPSSSRHTKVDLCQNVSVSVEPLVDRLTMFGSMQSSSNYSLAGTVVVEVPKLDVPRVSAAAAISPDGSVSDHPAIHVEALTVCFIGYSVYVDATGRYNAIKLAEISQELLQPQGCTCPVPLVEHTDASPSHLDAPSPTVKYETEFDLSIPGWLPASQRSRFGATFYCVQASATVQGRAVVSALAAFGRRPSDGQSPSINTATSLEAEQREPIVAASAVERKESVQSASATARPKSKGTWLNKRAKQLQLRTSRKSSPSEADLTSTVAIGHRGSGSKDFVSASGESDPLFSKTSEASNQTLPNGQHLLKSECISILVRRCRDVVPVPVARLARLAIAGEVPSAQDAPPHSLSQSMLALAALQEAPATSNARIAPTAPAPAHERPHLPASVSAPTFIAPLSNSHQQLDVLSASGTSAATAAGESTTAPALAPSPNIDTHPARMGPPRCSIYCAELGDSRRREGVEVHPSARTQRL